MLNQPTVGCVDYVGSVFIYHSKNTGLYTFASTRLSRLVDNIAVFYQALTYFIHSPSHHLISLNTSVVGVVLPRFHTTYNNVQLNIFSISY